jgi:hypothetical protein
MTQHRYFTGLLAAAAAGLAGPVLLAACSGTANSPSVAGLGTAAASASGSPTSTLSAYQQSLAFSACMRTHGVPDFPDPKQGSSGGPIVISGSSGVKVQSPAFQAAMRSCKKLAPAGNGGAGGLGKSFDAAKVPAWSACIRSHGLPDFPDPKTTASGMQLDLAGLAKSTFKNAMTACQSKYPGGDLTVSVGSGTGSGASGG